jgi:hypothetical protein
MDAYSERALNWSAVVSAPPARTAEGLGGKAQGVRKRGQVRRCRLAATRSVRARMP